MTVSLRIQLPMRYKTQWDKSSNCQSKGLSPLRSSVRSSFRTQDIYVKSKSTLYKKSWVFFSYQFSITGIVERVGLGLATITDPSTGVCFLIRHECKKRP
jgi:hypothetical protein